LPLSSLFEETKKESIESLDKQMIAKDSADDMDFTLAKDVYKIPESQQSLDQ